MPRSCQRPHFFPLAAIFFLLPATGLVQGQGRPIPFDEDYALSFDRSKALEKLIPGTRSYYYYHCLHALDQRQYDRVEALLKPWIKRWGRSSQVIEIENRRALLRYAKDTSKTYDFLRSRLGLNYPWQRQIPGQKPQLPSTLPPELLSRSRLDKIAFARHRGTVNGFRRSAYRRLASRNLDANQFFDLMRKLDEPDVPGLVDLVLRELSNRNSRGFGGLPIHRKLFLEQLEQLAQQRPALLRDQDFVYAYLERLRPEKGVSTARDSAARLVYLERLSQFASRLSTRWNSLKAHILYHRLVHDLEQGKPDQGRFLRYLALPRRARYYNSDRLRERGIRLVNLSSVFPTGLARVGNDEKLVRQYLMHFLVGMDSYEVFTPNLDLRYLKRIFAETKILAGAEGKERWYSLLDDPSYYEQLEKRVEIDFVPGQKRYYARDESVSIDVDVKNVKNLILKIFEINAYNYIRGEGKEPDASINLDGLVAGNEKTFRYQEASLLRVRRHFDLPELREAGVYVVELIGNGLSSRAVIRKGRLQVEERIGAAGHAFRIVDETGAQRPNATLLFGKKEYHADKSGEITIPFSTKPGRKSLILREGKLSCLTQFQHMGESYQLSAAFHVDRESLLAGKKAKILMRPSLRLNGRFVGLAALESPVLEIQATNLDGTGNSQDVALSKLSMTQEYVHEIQVPRGLQSLSLKLRAKVRQLSTDRNLSLSSSRRSFQLNTIDRTAQTWAPLLSRDASGWSLDLLGKDGEPKQDIAVQLRLTHKDYKDPIDVALKSDEKGRVHLGALPGIRALQCRTGLPANFQTWTLRGDRAVVLGDVHGIVGTPIRLPYMGSASTISRSVAGLYEMRGKRITHDRFEHLALVDGFLEIRELPAGTYKLKMRETGDTLDLEVTEGKRRGSRAVGKTRILELQGQHRLQILSGKVDQDGLAIRLANAGPSTRVHVMVGRYVPANDAWVSMLAPYRPGPVAMPLDAALSTYHSGRKIGDEYRYILERRFAKKYPGNMLRRPGLILNPWELEPTNTMIGLGGGSGGKFGGRGGRRRSGGALGAGPSTPRMGGDPGTFPTLDFLPSAAQVLTNLRPDASGLVRIPAKELGDGQEITILALDAWQTVERTVLRDEVAVKPVSQALAKALDSEKHFVEERRVEFVGAGKKLRIENAGPGQVNPIDSLSAAFQLFRSLSRNQELTSFAFLLDWPKLSAEKKRDEYAKHACHELHFFLYMKDRAFFDEVVRPYLANKMDKTFMDEWLLEMPLQRYLDPSRFAQLNIVEKILLSQRIMDEREATRRYVADRFDLLPPDPERELRLFHAALRSQDMDAGNVLGKKLAKLKEFRKRPSKQGGPTTPAPPGGHQYRGPGNFVPPSPKAPNNDFKTGRGRRMEKMAKDEEVMEEAEAEDKAFEGARLRDMARRKNQSRLYRAPDQTKRYVEHNYWHKRLGDMNASLVRVNAFWRDYAASLGQRPFFSSHLAEANRNLTEMLFALAVIDLPFEAGSHEVKIDGNALVFQAASPMLLLRKDLVAGELERGASDILVSQNYYRLDERYRYVGRQRVDAYIQDEFLVDVAYGCQVVLTNPSSTPRRLELLLQIPEGALPVQSGFYQRGMTVDLRGYATRSITYAFYFPRPKTAAHYPVQVASNGKVVASAGASALRVLATPSKVDTLSWEHVSQNGTADDVVNYLSRANLGRVDLVKILWRLKDRAVYDRVIGLLRKRHHYDRRVWSYSILHRDEPAAREFLRGENQFLRYCGKALESDLVTIDPVERKSYQHVEFDPLFNPRAHRFGPRRQILNTSLAHQYEALLGILRYRPVLDSQDWMSVTYYLLLQDRVEDALASFARVDVSKLPMRIQYDYMRAYLDFYSDDAKIARGIAERYKDHPVARWRTRFREVIAQLDEAEGKGAANLDKDDRESVQQKLAAEEASLELAVEDRSVRLQYHKVGEAEFNYYVMDVESLFSAHPFVQGGAGAFAYIRPNYRETRACPKGKSELVFDLPARFHNKNVLVEVRSKGLVKRSPYYANSLDVHFAENFGHLTVRAKGSGAPLKKVYVKVYARAEGGRVRFHKDGYTDLRGRFDYSSLSGKGAMNVSRFAVLVLSEKHGAVIRELAPPAR